MADPSPAGPTPGATLPLSVALACRNNAGTIGRLLESLSHLAPGGASGGGLPCEVVALDNGSTDGTIEMLDRAGATVIRGQWRGYTKTKQEVMDACTRPWVLNLDSDESLEPGLAAAITEVVRRDDAGVAAYRVNRQTWYRGRPLRHAWQPEWITRLVQRGAGEWTGAEPHARLEVRTSGRIVDLGGGEGENLRHDSFATFAEHLARQATYSRLGAEALFAEGKRGSYVRLLTSPAGAFLKQVVLKRAFLDGTPGWLAAATTAAGALMKHAILIELSQASVDGGGSRPGGGI